MKTLGRFVFDNTTVQTLTANSNIPLSNSTVTNNCLSCDGYNITIDKGGTYLIIADFTFAATAAGNIETQMFRNGNAIAGAHAIESAAASGDYASQAFSTLITVGRNNQTVINFKALTATSVRVANVLIIKAS